MTATDAEAAAIREGWRRDGFGSRVLNDDLEGRLIRSAYATGRASVVDGGALRVALSKLANECEGLLGAYELSYYIGNTNCAVLQLRVDEARKALAVAPASVQGEAVARPFKCAKCGCTCDGVRTWACIKGGVCAPAREAVTDAPDPLKCPGDGCPGCIHCRASSYPPTVTDALQVQPQTATGDAGSASSDEAATPEIAPSFECSLAAIDAHDPQSFIDGAKWAVSQSRWATCPECGVGSFVEHWIAATAAEIAQPTINDGRKENEAGGAHMPFLAPTQGGSAEYLAPSPTTAKVRGTKVTVQGWYRHHTVELGYDAYDQVVAFLFTLKPQTPSLHSGSASSDEAARTATPVWQCKRCGCEVWMSRSKLGKKVKICHRCNTIDDSDIAHRAAATPSAGSHDPMIGVRPDSQPSTRFRAMTLRERLYALADGGSWVGGAGTMSDFEFRALAIAAARMALDEAQMHSLGHGCHSRIRTLAASLDHEGMGNG